MVIFIREFVSSKRKRDLYGEMRILWEGGQKVLTISGKVTSRRLRRPKVSMV